MLLNMHIKNIALIDNIDIGFNDELNVLTGETGAGKSIIIGSLGICLGGKFHRELLRNDEQDGLIELLFSVDNENIKNTLSKIEIYPDEEDQVLISRHLTSSGKCINRINGNTVTISKLKEVAGFLIDLHAQHEQQTLLKISRHLEILDRFGQEEILDLKQKVSRLYGEYNQIKNEIGANNIDEAERIKRIDYLKFEINEIDIANLVVGEDEVLEAKFKKAANSKEIIEKASYIYNITSSLESDSASDLISKALGQMKKITDIDADANNTYETLQDVESILNDFNSGLADYMKEMEFDTNSFNELEERLDQINLLKSKYGNNVSEIIETRDKLEDEYDKLILHDKYIEDLNEQLNEVTRDLESASDILTKARKKHATRLCELIKNSLYELNFENVEFDMNFDKTKEFTANGNDEAYFIISTNVGQPMKPLNEVASGGELSRIMLAIKSCLAYEDDTPTLVFDEIDIGISGRTAQKVAEKMSILGKKHQIICITHLPQISAMADTHYNIMKTVANNNTTTTIKQLTYDESITEIARLLGGASITDTVISSAKELKVLADMSKNG